MSDDELEVMRSAMNQAVEDQLVILQKHTMILATAVSGSPFLGLFGTVWGITVAFTKLAQAGKADVQTLAPGVSGALLAAALILFGAFYPLESGLPCSRDYAKYLRWFKWYNY